MKPPFLTVQIFEDPGAHGYVLTRRSSENHVVDTIIEADTAGFASLEESWVAAKAHVDQIIRHTLWKGDNCPECASADVEKFAAEMQDDGITMLVPFRCRSCDCEWMSTFKLDHAHIVGDGIQPGEEGEGYEITPWKD